MQIRSVRMISILAIVFSFSIVIDTAVHQIWHSLTLGSVFADEGKDEIEKLDVERDRKLSKLEEDYQRELKKANEEYKRDASNRGYKARAKEKYRRKQSELRKKFEKKQKDIQIWYDEKLVKLEKKESRSD